MASKRAYSDELRSSVNSQFTLYNAADASTSIELGAAGTLQLGKGERVLQLRCKLCQQSLKLRTLHQRIAHLDAAGPQPWADRGAVCSDVASLAPHTQQLIAAERAAASDAKKPRLDGVLLDEFSAAAVAAAQEAAAAAAGGSTADQPAAAADDGSTAAAQRALRPRKPPAAAGPSMGAQAPAQTVWQHVRVICSPDGDGDASTGVYDPNSKLVLPDALPDAAPAEGWLGVADWVRRVLPAGADTSNASIRVRELLEDGETGRTLSALSQYWTNGRDPGTGWQRAGNTIQPLHFSGRPEPEDLLAALKRSGGPPGEVMPTLEELQLLIGAISTVLADAEASLAGDSVAAAAAGAPVPPASSSGQAASSSSSGQPVASPPPLGWASGWVAGFMLSHNTGFFQHRRPLLLVPWPLVVAAPDLFAQSPLNNCVCVLASITESPPKHLAVPYQRLLAAQSVAAWAGWRAEIERYPRRRCLVPGCDQRDMRAPLGTERAHVRGWRLPACAEHRQAEKVLLPCAFFSAERCAACASSGSSGGLQAGDLAGATAPASGSGSGSGGGLSAPQPGGSSGALQAGGLTGAAAPASGSGSPACLAQQQAAYCSAHRKAGLHGVFLPLSFFEVDEQGRHARCCRSCRAQILVAEQARAARSVAMRTDPVFVPGDDEPRARRSPPPWAETVKEMVALSAAVRRQQPAGQQQQQQQQQQQPPAEQQQRQLTYSFRLLQLGGA